MHKVCVTECLEEQAWYGYDSESVVQDHASSLPSIQDELKDLKKMEMESYEDDLKGKECKGGFRLQMFYTLRHICSVGCNESVKSSIILMTTIRM